MNVPAIVLSILGIITIGFLGSFVYLSLNGKDYSSNYLNAFNPSSNFALSNGNNSTYNTINISTSEGIKTIIIKTNTMNYSTSDIERALINYTSIILKLYNLHNIPFTSITPKIQIYIDNNAYFIEIINGNIIINNGNANGPDLQIKTTSRDILNMQENNIPIKDAISSGKIEIDIIADKFTLFAKGYLSLYNEISS